MEDFDIEPPEAPKGFSPAGPPTIDPEVPLPSEKEDAVKENIFSRLFKKKKQVSIPLEASSHDEKASPRDVPIEPIPATEGIDAPDQGTGLFGDTIIAPPELDEFHSAQTEEMDVLRERLKEFIVPREEKLDRIEIALEEKPMMDAKKDEKPFRSLFKKKNRDEPAWITEELAEDRPQTKNFPPFPGGESPDETRETITASERAAEELASMVNQQDLEPPQIPSGNLDWTTEHAVLPVTSQRPIMSISGKVLRSKGKKPELVVQNISIPLERFKEEKTSLDTTAELPAPKTRRHAHPHVKPLSPQEIEHIVTSLTKAEQDYSAKRMTVESYLRFLQQELHEIIKAPSAYQEVTQDKEKIEQKLRKCMKRTSEISLAGKKARSIADLAGLIDHLHESAWRSWKSENRQDINSWLGGQGKKDLAAALMVKETKSAALALLKEEGKRDAQANRKRKDEVKRLQHALSLIQEKEKEIGLSNLSLFFRLHKPTSLEGVLRLLKTVEFLYKIDLDTVIVHSGKDFERWFRSFLAKEKERSRFSVDAVKQALQSAVNESLERVTGEIARERAILDHALATLQDEREKLLTERKAFEDEKAGLQAVIDKNVAAITARALQHEALVVKENNEKALRLAREREELDRIRERQNIEVISEIQKNEKLKKAVEAERFLLEEDRKDLRAEKKVYEEQKKRDTTDKKAEIAHLKVECRILLEKTRDEKKKLEAMQKDYHEKIQKEYLSKAKDIERMREGFTSYRESEMLRLEDEKETIERQRRDLKSFKQELELQEDRITKAITLGKAEIARDLEEVRKIDQNLERMESELKKEREAIEKEGFEKYLCSRLSEIDPLKGNQAEMITKIDHDMEVTEHKKAYDMIEECRGLLSEGKVEEAKSLYNTIRTTFANMGENERSEIYAAIKELYTDIHLANVGG